MASKEVESVRVRTLADLEQARRVLRRFALDAGMPAISAEELVTAASELSSNLLKHTSGGGIISWCLRAAEDEPTSSDDRGVLTVEVVVADFGPGISDIPQAMRDGYSTGGTLGSGLPAARRLVDTFRIESSSAGTTISLGKRIPSA